MISTTGSEDQYGINVGKRIVTKYILMNLKITKRTLQQKDQTIGYKLRKSLIW